MLGQRTSVAQSIPFARDRDVNAFFHGAQHAAHRLAERAAVGSTLDLTAAVRHEDYSDFGSTTDPKVGLVWEPLDGFNLRATYGTSFRAPYLNQFDDCGSPSACCFRRALRPTGDSLRCWTRRPART